MLGVEFSCNFFCRSSVHDVLREFVTEPEKTDHPEHTGESHCSCCLLITRILEMMDGSTKLTSDIVKCEQCLDDKSSNPSEYL